MPSLRLPPLLKKIFAPFFRTHNLLALLAGFLVFLSQYPLSWLPGLYIGLFIILFLFLKQPLPPSLKILPSAFLLGCSFGYGFFFPSFYWIPSTFLVYAEQLFPLIPFALLLFPAFFSLFFGTATALASLFPHHLTRILAFIAFLSLADFLRGTILSGLPWNSLGYAWGTSNTLMQTSSLIGITGVSLLAISLAVLAISPFLFPLSKITFSSSALGILILFSFHFWGNERIHNLSPLAEKTHNTGIRIVQPNITQTNKWNNNSLRQSFLRLLSLSILQRPPWIKHIIWPETATPFLLLGNQEFRSQLIPITPPNGSLITGTPRTDTSKINTYYNSLVAFSPSQNIIGIYDKQHLVPFGEYTPLNDLFSLDSFLGKLGHYSPGKSSQTPITLPNMPPMLPSICYEILFSHEILSHFLSQPHKPQWLLNLTNDAWFGYSLAPLQHMDMARWRAVELGIPLVRVNNTGRSAVINALGQPLQYRLTHKVGIIDFKLPKALPHNTTFSSIGLWGFFFPWLVLCSAILTLSAFRPFRSWKT